MNRDLNILERQALSVALAGTEAWLAELRAQVRHLRVVSRKYTGFGFFTDFVCEGCLPASGLPSPGSPLRVPVAWAAHPDVENGGSGAVCFNVFLKEGVIVCLEGASTSTWPATEELITFAG